MQEDGAGRAGDEQENKNAGPGVVAMAVVGGFDEWMEGRERRPKKHTNREERN